MAARALIAGYFSFDGNVTTAGDVLAADVVAGWLRRAGVAYDVALAAKYGEGVDWEHADPSSYTHVVWVCGPMTQGPRQTALRERFRDCRLVAVDVSRLDDLGDWNPYDAVVERDSAARSRPDLALLASGELPPVVGLCLIESQREYGERGRHEQAVAALQALIESRPMSVVNVNTVLKPSRPGRRTPLEVEALLARMDVVLTNRLHGLVLSIKHGVPVVAVDSVQGGGKVSRQARALGWPAALRVEALSAERLSRAFELCLSPEGRELAASARERGMRGAAALESEFLVALGPEDDGHAVAAPLRRASRIAR